MKNTISEIEFGVLEKDILSEKIAFRLLSLIKDRQIRPGDRLPPERELATMMHVSRPSVREALRALSIMGIIDNQQGSGTYVTALEPSRLVEHLDFILSIDDSTFLDLFEARRIVEVGITGIAAQKISDEEMEELKKCLIRSESVIEDHEQFLECDLEIHKRIADAAQNKILSILMMTLNKLNVYSRKRTVAINDVRQQTLADHRLIIQAIEARNPAAACQAMENHLNYVEQRLKQIAREEAETAGSTEE